jgi:hypothetical protein
VSTYRNRIDDLGITSEFSRLARQPKFCVSFRFVGCRCWRLLLVNGRPAARRCNARPRTRRPRPRPHRAGWPSGLTIFSAAQAGQPEARWALRPARDPGAAPSAVAAAFLQPVYQQDQGSWLEVALVPGA